MTALHCASTFLAVIVLSAPAGGTRRHVHSFLSPVAYWLASGYSVESFQHGNASFGRRRFYRFYLQSFEKLFH
jgi:hypothetical protein